MRAQITQWTTCLICVIAALCATATGAKAHPPAIRGVDLGIAHTVRETAFSVAQEPESERAHGALQALQTIVIDPGHGGSNQGAIGVAEIHEKFITMELAYQLRDELRRTYPAARIILTRYWDREVGLSERTHFANQLDADLFISLHYNAAVHDRAVGVETYFLSTEQAVPGAAPQSGEPIASAQANVTGLPSDDTLDQGSRQGVYNDAMLTLQRDLARARQHERSGLLAEIVQRAMVTHTGTMDRGVKQANFAVLRGALMPAVVVEAGFVTHPKEGRRVLRDRHRDKVVEALMESIAEFDAAIASQQDASAED